MQIRKMFKVNKSKIKDLRDSNVLSLRRNSPIFEIHSDAVNEFWDNHHRAIMSAVVPLVVIIVAAIGFSSRGAVAEFSPTDCLGGWYNTDGAEGKPDLDEKSKIVEFTEENSAYLTKGKSGSIFCSSFSGEIPSDKYPKTFDLKLSWAVDDGSFSHQVKNSEESVEGAFKAVEESVTEEQNISEDNSSTPDSESEEIPTEEEVIVPEEQPADEEVPVEVPPEETTPTEESPVAAEPTPESEPTPEPTPEPEPAPEESVDGMGFRKIFEKIIFAFDAKEVFAEGEETPAPEEPVSEPEPTPQSEPTPEPESTPEPEIVSEPTPEPVAEEAPVVAPEETPVVEAPLGESEIITEESNDGSTEEDSVVEEDKKDEDKKEAEIEEDKSVSDEPLYEIFMNVGGDEWVSLGTVGYDNWKDYTVSLPIYSWQDIGSLQIEIRSLPTLDALPVVYLDGMVLEVTYDDMTSIPDLSPDFDNDLVSYDETFEDNVRIIRVVRPNGEAEVWMTTMASGSVPIYQNWGKDRYENLDVSTSTEDLIIGTNEISEEESGIGGEESTPDKVSVEEVAVLVDEEGGELVVSEVLDNEEKDSEEKTFDTGLGDTGNVLEGVFDSVEYSGDLFINNENTVDVFGEFSTTENMVASSSDPVSIFSKETLTRKRGGMDENGEPLVWERIINSDLVSNDTELFYDGGVLFWISKMGESMQAFDTRSKTVFSTTLKNKNGTFEIEYIGAGGDVKVASLSDQNIFNVRVGDIQ